MKQKEKVMRRRVFAVLLAVMLVAGEFGMSGIMGVASGDVSGNEEWLETVSSGEVSDNDFTVSDNDVSEGDCSEFESEVSGEDAAVDTTNNDENVNKDVSGNDVGCGDVSGCDVSGNDDISGSDILGNNAYAYDTISGNASILSSGTAAKKKETDLARKPERPELGYGPRNNQKIVICATTVTLKMTAESGCKIYYSLDGKNPAFKAGVPSSNATLFSKSAKIGNQSKIVVKAIAVNAAGLCSDVTTHTFTFKPAVTKIVLSALGSTSKKDEKTGVTTVSVNLVKGKSLKLNATYTPEFAVNKDLTWEIISSPANFGNAVKISSKGKITTKRNAVAGTYKVRATLKGNPSVKATIHVKVVDLAIISSLKVNQKKVSLVTKGKTATSYNMFNNLQINATKTRKATDFVWTTSDKTIATVSKSGVVKTVVGKKGKAVITAEAKDGSGKKAKCTVNVSQLATSVTISGESKLGIGQSIKLNATAAPVDAASQKVKWEISKYPAGADASQIKINSGGKLTAKKNAVPGKYTITASALDGSGKSDTFEVTVQCAIASVTISSEDFTIYRVSGGKSIGAPISKAVATVTLGTDGKESTNVEVLNSAPGIVKATYSTSTKKITIKATGTAAGNATITLQAKDGSKKKDTINVTVANPPSSIKIELPKDSTGDLAMNYTHKPKVVFGTKYGDPGKVKMTWSLVKENANIQLNASTGELKIKNTATAGETFKLKAVVDELKLSDTVSCTARTKIKKLAVYFNGAKIVGEPISEYGKTNNLQVLVQEDGSSKMQFASEASVTKSITLTASSDDLGLIYNSSKKIGTIKSIMPGKYKITVKALDGTGKSKTYKIRVR